MVFLILVGALLARDHGPFFTGKYLWWEDGTIFFHQANTLGWGSFFTPYAGYLHFYPRLIAWAATAFPLTAVPWVYAAGWCLSALFLAWVLFRQTRRVGAGTSVSLLLVALVFLQPTTGEVFFSLTNSIWPIGAALSLLLLGREEGAAPLTPVGWTVFFILCLTGPFIIFLAPFWLVKKWVESKLRHDKALTAWVVLSGTLQGFLTVRLGRLTLGSIGSVMGDWFRAVESQLTFGADDRFSALMALLFWGCLATAALRSLRSKEAGAQHRNLAALLSIGLAIALVAGSVFEYKEALPFVSRFGLNDRYRWIPFTLFAFGGVLLTHEWRKTRAVLLIALIGICWHGFMVLSRPNLQFKAFARFAQYQDVTIPNAPQMGTINHWRLDTADIQGRRLQPILPRDLPPTLGRLSGMTWKGKRGELALDPTQTSAPPNLVLGPELLPEGTRFVGVEVRMFRDQPGCSKIYWSGHDLFDERQSLARNDPAGEITAHYAFPFDDKELWIALFPIETPAALAIRSIRLFPLP